MMQRAPPRAHGSKALGEWCAPSGAARVVGFQRCFRGDGQASSHCVVRSPLVAGLAVSEDSFAWSHPMCSGETFIVDDVAERAMREAASQGHEVF
jgi:hypothetical protein